MRLDQIEMFTKISLKQIFVGKTLLTLLHSEWPKLYRVSAILSAKGLTKKQEFLHTVLVYYVIKCTNGKRRKSLVGF